MSGSEKFAESQKAWLRRCNRRCEKRLGFAADRITVLSESGAGTTIANRDNVTRTLAALKSRLTADDTLLVVLIGHGTFDGTAAKFNLVGPDMDSREWKAALDGNPARLVFVNTTSSSFQFVPALSGKNRIVIAATDSAAQKYATMFPQYFIEALEQGAKADNDKNGRLSVWEAFAYASQAVKQAFEQKGTLVTERSVIDDNGDGVGKEAPHSRHRWRARQDDVPRSASRGELGQRRARRARKAPHRDRSRDRAAEGAKGRDAGRAVRGRIRTARHRAREGLRTDSIVEVVSTSHREDAATQRIRGPSLRSPILSRGLEQLDRIAIRILDLDLLAARPGLHVVPKTEAGLLQGLDERGKIVDPQHDTVPSARFLLLTVRHRPRSGRLWTAEQNVRVAERDVGKRGKLLVFEREAQMCRVERDRASHVSDLISDTVHALDERMRIACHPCSICKNSSGIK